MNCCLDESASDMVESALDDGAAAVVGEVAQTAQTCLDAAPHQPFIDRPLVVGAGIERNRLDRTGIRVEARSAAGGRPSMTKSNTNVNAYVTQDQPKIADIRPARLDLAHDPTSDDRDQQNSVGVARHIRQKRFGHLTARFLRRHPTRNVR